MRRFFGADRVSQILVAGVVMISGAGLLGTHMSGISGSHEIAIVLPFGAVLAGRLLGTRLLAAGLAPTLAVVLAGYLLALGYDATRRAGGAQTGYCRGWLV